MKLRKTRNRNYVSEDGRLWGANPKERIQHNIQINSSTGCWEWKKHRNKQGYGRISVALGSRTDRLFMRAHRYAWEAFVGPIPEGQLVCHRCDNPSCCNPDHLFLGTQLENVKDMYKKGRRTTWTRNVQKQKTA